MTTPSLTGFDKRARQMIDLALQRGWTGRMTSKGHFLAKAPDGKTTITIPSKMDSKARGAANAMSIFKRWMREQGTPQAAALMDLAVEGLDSIRYDDGDLIAVGNMDDLIAVDILTGAAKKKMALEAPTPKGTPVERTVLTEKPWLARKSPNKHGGTLYESAAVTERTYSDGTVDYACSTRCGYESDNARSVAAHYGKAHTIKGEGTPADEAVKNTVPGVDYTEPDTTRYKPTERLVHALAAFLADLPDLSAMSADDLAVAFLTWANDRPDLDGIEKQPPRPLTDTEIVARIRTLVGQPLAIELDRTRDALASALERVEALTAERNEIAARMVSVERDLDAMRDLMNAIGRTS